MLAPRIGEGARQRLLVTGIVQGVGFRPFVYTLARHIGLTGWVCNTSAGVTVEVQGAPEALDAFRKALVHEAPSLAHIERIIVEDLPLVEGKAFEIRESKAEVGAFQPISPDLAICPDCLRELFDPTDRRFRYPFINCTNCGPRFTIIKDIPYDRPITTMAPFEMCPECAREYRNPVDRRFHAQPIACAQCGPRVWLAVDGKEQRDHPIEQAQSLLDEGKVVAVKGLGGFHLACDATNEAAVTELRRRKGRVDKPFALMMADMATIESFCRVSDEERALLESRQRPIVLLWRRAETETHLAAAIAPGQQTIGVMLPYTPLHYLLFDGESPQALVMTSGNFSEEPIASDNADALERLAPLADAFLLHDRDIHIRTDDSVLRVFAGHELPIRRSRGYAPYPVALPFDAPPVLAVGGELKNTFCITRERYAFLSQHIGDLENLETLQSFEHGIRHFAGLFRSQPEVIAHDLHPDYLATDYAATRADQEGLQLIAVQHHHAHIAACMAENGHPGAQPVIGVAFDGTGFGADGAIWGGEFLIADYAGFERVAHFAYVPLPGGDAGTRKPARVALSYLRQAGLAPDGLPLLGAFSATELRLVERQIETGFNAPPTSSAGRLFDAVASIAGLRQEVNYEGQAAIELEAIADPAERGRYAFAGRMEADIWTIDTGPVIRSVVEDVREGTPPPVISARFHNGLAALIRDVCCRLHRNYGLNQVVLSGGVFQNITLLAKTLDLLRADGFEVLTHHLVPPNDGGIALGQAVIATKMVKRAKPDDSVGWQH